MMIVEVTEQPVGQEREIFAIYVRYAEKIGWSSWMRSTQRKTLEEARQYAKDEAGDNKSFGGLMAPVGLRQFMIRSCVETNIEIWDTSAKKIEPTKRRKRA